MEYYCHKLKYINFYITVKDPLLHECQIIKIFSFNIFLVLIFQQWETKREREKDTDTKVSYFPPSCTGVFTCAVHSSLKALVSSAIAYLKTRLPKNKNKNFQTDKASKSVLSFQLLLRSLIGLFPTYLPATLLIKKMWH